MFIEPEVTIRIDLNALRGDRLIATRAAVVSPLFVLMTPMLSPGQYVRAVEEEGDAYVAVVERVEGDAVHLHLLPETMTPRAFFPMIPTFTFSDPLYGSEPTSTRTVDSATIFEEVA